MEWPTHHSYGALSWLTGIPKSNLSSYRYQTKAMSAKVAERIEVAGRVAENSPILRHRLAGFPQLALAIKRHMTVDPVHCTRLIAQTVGDLKSLESAEDIAAFHLRPPTTGIEQWNQLLAGIAAFTWDNYGSGEAPAWTELTRSLSDWWQPVTGFERWRDQDLLDTPVTLRERSIIYPVAWLETT